MLETHYTQDEFNAFYYKHECTINKMARRFYSTDNFYYNELRGVLIRHLWEVYLKLNDKTVIEKETCWIETVLFNRACNFRRDLLCISTLFQRYIIDEVTFIW